MTDGLPSTALTAQRLSEALVRVGTDRMITRLGLCRNVLKDVFAGDPMVVSVLAAAVEHGAVADLVRDGMSVDAELLAPRVADDLARAGGFSAERASWAVGVWACALGIPGVDRAPYRPVDPTVAAPRPPLLASDSPTTAAVSPPSAGPTQPLVPPYEPPPGPLSDPSPEPPRPRWRGPAVLAAAAVAIAALAAVLVAVVVNNGKANPAAQPTTSHGNSGRRLDTNGSFEARALVMPAQAITGVRPNPFAEVTFGIPTDDQAYERLPNSRQLTLINGLGHVDCTAPPPLLPSATDRVVCDDTGTFAALTGPVILRAADVASAFAVPPSTSRGTVDWAVEITFTTAGTDAWSTYTAAHNASGSQAGSLFACGSQTLPCADFVVFIVGGDAVSIPVNVAASTPQVQISGNFTEASAKTLARQISDT